MPLILLLVKHTYFDLNNHHHLWSVCTCTFFKNVLLSTKRPHERKIMNLFRKLKLDLHIFQLYFTPPTPSLKQSDSKTTLGPYTPNIFARSTIPFSKCFQSYGYINKYADRGNRTNIVYLRRLLLARAQLPGLHKEIC